MVRRPKVFAALLALPLLVVIVASCSNQGEGERCDTSSDDCQSGLVCTIVSATGSVSTEGFCCPANKAASSSENCSVQAVKPGEVPAPDASATASDGGTTDASATPDAASSSDAASDADAAP